MPTNTQQTLCINSLDIPRRTYSEQLDNAMSLSSPRLQEIINQNQSHELEFYDFSYTLTPTTPTAVMGSLHTPRCEYM